MGLFEKLKQGLSKTRDSLGKAVDGVLSTFTRIDDDLFDELEEVLLQADLGLDATEEILEQLKDEVKQQRVSDPGQIRELLAGLLGRMLEQEEESPLRLESKPSVILVIGVNGVGKTTTIGKLAAYFGEQGKKVLLGAADTSVPPPQTSLPSGRSARAPTWFATRRAATLPPWCLTRLRPERAVGPTSSSATRQGACTTRRTS